MTEAEFLEKYPRPWRFEQSAPDGSGVVVAANDRPLVVLSADVDWDDESGSDYPLAFNTDEEAELLLGLLLGPHTGP